MYSEYLKFKRELNAKKTTNKMSVYRNYRNSKT